MAKWMKLHDVEKEPLWVDIDKVVTMRWIEDEKCTVLYFNKDYSWSVLEHPDKIAPSAI